MHVKLLIRNMSVIGIEKLACNDLKHREGLLSATSTFIWDGIEESAASKDHIE